MKQEIYCKVQLSFRKDFETNIIKNNLNNEFSNVIMNNLTNNSVLIEFSTEYNPCYTKKKITPWIRSKIFHCTDYSSIKFLEIKEEAEIYELN